MTELSILFSGPVLTLGFGLIILLSQPWLLLPVCAPWILMTGVVSRVIRREGGIAVAMERSHGFGVLITAGALVLLAHLTPLLSSVLASFTGKAPFDQHNILFDLCAGSCASSMMLLTSAMTLLCGIAFRSVGLRHMIVLSGGVPAIACDIWGVYSITGSGDGQAAFAYPISPIYGHVAGSVVTSLFAAPLFWKWWWNRRDQAPTPH